MKLDASDMRLSGQAFTLEEGTEWQDDNLMIISQGAELFEIISGEENLRWGWIVLGDLLIKADFTSHTDRGMVGKSVADEIKYPLLLDPSQKLSDLYLATEERDTTDAQIVFGKYTETSGLKFHDDTIMDIDEMDAIICISTESELVFVHTPKNSVRIRGADHGEIMVLNREIDSLTMVTKDDGIVHVDAGKQQISVGPGGKIVLDGKEFDPKKVIKDVTNTVMSSLSNLSNFGDFKFN